MLPAERFQHLSLQATWIASLKRDEQSAAYPTNLPDPLAALVLLGPALTVANEFCDPFPECAYGRPDVENVRVTHPCLLEDAGIDSRCWPARVLFQELGGYSGRPYDSIDTAADRDM